MASLLDALTAAAQERFGFAYRHRWGDNLRVAVGVWAKTRGLTHEQIAEQLLRDPQLLTSLIGEVTVGESAQPACNERLYLTAQCLIGELA